MFVHGAAFDHTVWKLQARYFAWNGGSVLAVDLPGHGRSEGPPRPTIGAMADWLVALMDAAQVGSANLVGHSMGALVALDAAARHGARVSKLALLGVAPAIPVNDLLLGRSAEDDHQALELLTGWGYGRRAHFGGHRMPGLWMTGGGLRTLERAAPGVLLHRPGRDQCLRRRRDGRSGGCLPSTGGDRRARFDDAGEARPRACRNAGPTRPRW